MQHVTDEPIDPIAPRADAAARARADSVDLAVAGMGCPNCGNRVRNALLGLRPVVDVEVDVTRGLAKVWFDGSRLSIDDLKAVVEAEGAESHQQFIAVVVGRSLPGV